MGLELGSSSIFWFEIMIYFLIITSSTGAGLGFSRGGGGWGVSNNLGGGGVGSFKQFGGGGGGGW